MNIKILIFFIVQAMLRGIVHLDEEALHRRSLEVEPLDTQLPVTPEGPSPPPPNIHTYSYLPTSLPFCVVPMFMHMCVCV